jgi:hypothetical protein
MSADSGHRLLCAAFGRPLKTEASVRLKVAFRQDVERPLFLFGQQAGRSRPSGPHLGQVQPGNGLRLGCGEQIELFGGTDVELIVDRCR